MIVAIPPKRAVSLVICYSQADLALQQEFVTSLAPLVREGLLSVWSHADILIGAEWREARSKHLSEAELIVLLVSKHFLADSFCSEVELPIAMQRQADHVSRVLPVLLNHCEWQATLLADKVLALHGVPLATFENHDAAWQQVTTQLKTLMKEVPLRPHRCMTIPVSPSLIHPLKVPAAFERAEIIEEIRQAFLTAHPPRVVCLYGQWGQGKSRLAFQYAQKHRHEYSALFHVNASNETNLQSGFYDIAVNILQLKLNDPQSIREGIEACRRWMSINTNWLLILDEATPHIIDEWIPNMDGDILITSYDDMRGLAVHPPDRSIHIRELSNDEALRFVTERMGRALTIDESNAVTQIAESLGFCQFALEQAVSFVFSKKLRLRSYLDRLHSHPLEILTMNPGIRISIEATEAEGPLTRAFLELFAVQDCHQIPVDLFCPERLRMLGEPISQLTSMWEVEEALAPLVSYSLLSFDPSRGTYGIKQLVQTALRHRMSTESQQLWAERTVDLVSHAMSCSHFQDWPRQLMLAPLVRSAVHLVKTYGFVSNAALRLLNQAGFFLIQQGDYDRAEHCYRLALMQPHATVINERQPDYADSHNGLGRVLYHIGDYFGAQREYQQALTIRSHMLGTEHPDTASSLNNLALLFFHTDPLHPEIEDMFRSSLAIRERTLGHEHPHVAKSQTNLGVYLTQKGGEQGKSKNTSLLQEAEAQIQSALQLRLRIFSPGHPDVASSYLALARLARAKQDYVRSESLYKNALRINEESLGSKHQYLGHCMIGLARLYALQGRTELAKSTYQATLALWRQTMRPQHPLIAKCMFALAVLEQDIDPVDAMQKFQQALSIWDKTLDRKHPDYQACLRRMEIMSFSAMAS